MPLYMTQFAYTQDAWKALAKNPEDRSVPVRGLIEKLGGRFIGLYYSFGEYDGFVLWEAPDAIAVTAAVLAAGMPGHLKMTKTTTLLTPEQLIEALRKTGGVTYRGPTG